MKRIITNETQAAMKKLLHKLKDHEDDFAHGYSSNGIEVRLYNESIRDLFPDDIDGVAVNVVVTDVAKPR